MDTNIKKIRALNDNLRQNFTGGRVFITRGVAGLPTDKQLEVMEKVRNFNNFNKSNDPNGEHDFGAFDVDGVTYFWKIDYYDVDYQYLIAIVCDKVDRLQRSFKEYHFIMDLVENHRMQLHFVTENEVVTKDSDKPNGHIHRYLFCPYCKDTRINENIIDAKIKDDLCRLKKMPLTLLEQALVLIQEEVKEKHKIEIEERRILKSKRTQLENSLDMLLDMRLNNSITQEQYNKNIMTLPNR